MQVNPSKTDSPPQGREERRWNLREAQGGLHRINYTSLFILNKGYKKPHSPLSMSEMNMAKCQVWYRKDYLYYLYTCYIVGVL